ncbi:hypothetical protein [uncultured Jatrophihabitans sp.]|uniref:hypothetical protein n=1 Tax=uncultured Jatrophihabitans sp. TaxID=1610747 RepID=UPI0035C99562
MRHKHVATTGRRRRLPLLVGASAGVLALVGMSTIFGGSANAAAPKKNYHAGKDTATFTVTGVLDANCLVSVGGNKVYIKPGDELDFKSSAAGVGVNSGGGGGLLGGVTGLLTGSKLTGLRLSAYLDKGTKRQLHFDLQPGQTYKLKGLSSGSHSLAWTVTGVGVVGVGTVGTSSAQLKSGAKFSWTGGVYVSSGAPDCRLAVSTPDTQVSAGPVHVHVGQRNITTPVDPNKIVGKVKGVVKGATNKVAGKKPAAKPATTNNGSNPGSVNTANGLLPVPARVVPGGYGGTEYGSGGAGGYADSSTLTGAGGSNGYAALTMTSPNGKTTTVNGANVADQQPKADAKKSASAAQLPIVLAIIAVVALALVASTYARLFLLRHRS